MSDFADDFYDDDDQPATRKDPVRARLKQLEKENRDKDARIAQLVEMERKMVFMEAGINTGDPKFRYFVKGYDGELNPEAIRQAAEEAQLIAPQPPVDETDKQAWQTTNRIAAGAESSPEGPSWVKRIRDAQSEDEVMAVFAEAQAQGIDLSEI